MPSLMDVLSGMVTKKGRFGTDPYDIFSTTGCRGRRPLQNSLALGERVRVRAQIQKFNW